jgi:hypothetical protein
MMRLVVLLLVILSSSWANAQTDSLDGARVQVDVGGKTQEYRLVAQAVSTTQPATQATTRPTTAHIEVLKGTGGLPGQAVHVHAIHSQLADGTPLTARYAWDFGDPGSAFNEQVGFNAAHVYDKPGTYTIKLDVLAVPTGSVGSIVPHVQGGVWSSARVTVTIAEDTRKIISVGSQAEFDAVRGRLADNTILELAGGVTYRITRTLHLPNINFTLRSKPGTGKATLFKERDPSIGIVGVDQNLARSAVVENIIFDSIHDLATTPGDIPANGVYVGGIGMTVRGCEIRNVGMAISIEGASAGSLVQDCTIVSKGGCVWLRAHDTVLLGNDLRSLEQHGVRGAVSRVTLSNNVIRARSCLWGMQGEFLYARGNTFIDGTAAFNPYGAISERDPAALRSRWGVFENNRFQNGRLIIKHGAERMRITNNVLTISRQSAIELAGHSVAADRGIHDVIIANNTVVVSGDSGALLWLLGDAGGQVLPRASDVRVHRNLMIAPKLAGGHSGGVFTYDEKLASFASIGGNVWSMPQSFSQKICYAWPMWRDAKGEYNIERWNALDVVDGDRYDPLLIQLAPGVYHCEMNDDGTIAGATGPVPKEVPTTQPATQPTTATTTTTKEPAP